MRALLVDRWSRGSGPMHRCDPRAKTAVLLVFLIAVATAQQHLVVLGSAWLVSLIAAALWARLPAAGLLARAAIVLPFSLTFGAVNWAAGDSDRALALLLKSYLSAMGVLLVVGTTPVTKLLRGLEASGVPRFLLLVAQFLYRYLFVIGEEARHMRTAAESRGATIGGIVARKQRFQAAAGALAVLFARSYQRAEHIHRAMLARGFAGHFHALDALHFRFADGVFLLAGLVPVAIRVGVERMLG